MAYSTLLSSTKVEIEHEKQCICYNIGDVIRNKEKKENTPLTSQAAKTTALKQRCCCNSYTAIYRNTTRGQQKISTFRLVSYGRSELPPVRTAPPRSAAPRHSGQMSISHKTQSTSALSRHFRWQNIPEARCTTTQRYTMRFKPFPVLI